jgi:hypothetical protein
LLEEAAQFAVTAPSHAMFDQAPGLTFEDLRRKISDAVMRHGIRGVILDYWQLVGGAERGHTQAMHQDKVAQFLADAARREGIWVIAMAQLNQDGNTRGGEGIRLAFDQAFELHREPDSDGAWLQMIETRHTPWQDLGSKHQPGLWLHKRGLYFDERPLVEVASAALIPGLGGSERSHVRFSRTAARARSGYSSGGAQPHQLISGDAGR